MRTSSSLFLGAGLAALLVGPLAAGCGGSSESESPGGGGPSPDGGTVLDAGNDTGPKPDGGTEGGTEGGADTGADAGVNTECPASANDALELTVFDADAGTGSLQGVLADPLTSKCFYKFTGSAGQIIQLQTAAKPSNDPFNANYPDTVVTVYDANMTQLARNDDPIPRITNDATLWTKLPANGTYYVTVEECNGAFGAQSCADAAQITSYDFAVALVAPKSGDVEFNPEGAEPNDDAAHATSIRNDASTTTMGQYYIQWVAGDFSSATDVDAYSVSIPADLKLAGNQRGTLLIEAFPSGTEGSGSTTPVGPAWLVDDANNVVAKLDVSSIPVQGSESAGIMPPVTPGKTYTLYVEHPSTAAGASDFYFFASIPVPSSQLEASEDDGMGGFSPKNDDPGTALSLTASTNNKSAYYLDADLTDGADVDYFVAAVPNGLTDNTVSAGCYAEVNGSGLRGLKLSLFKADGTTPLGTGSTASESATAGATINPMSFGTETSVVLKVEAGGMPDGTIAGRFYSCGISFQ